MTARDSAAGVAASFLEFRRYRADSPRPLEAGRQLLSRRMHGPSEALDCASPALLAPTTPVFEEWLVRGEVHTERRGCLSYSTDGDWLFGTACVDDTALAGGLEAASLQAYAELFELLEGHGCPQLLRLWNYVAGINRPDGGLERYRHFNIGRQQAFLAARRSAFDGAPAACALGTEGGPLTVHFLAGRRSPRAIENPRQVSAYHYPSQYGPRSPTFSRAAVAELGPQREALFISGTASIVGHATLHHGDVRRQTEETLANIEAVLQAAASHSRAGGQHRLDRLDYTVYVRDARDLPAVRETLERSIGAQSPAAREAVYLRADICRADLLVEIEAQHIVDTKDPA
ncbi:Rid family hydrolase [Eleftheria terrae]|uniref:chorismate transformation enzyme, FkbO/Hyg5 family n=1 Tax=Eleftheria terrae TaxID=1597781 RepID=UPI00263AC691|nr:Rid family hydrolase [Eleftheria terrae]WKB54196.1 Rid family hydrolase [Eleftheria terrae]